MNREVPRIYESDPAAQARQFDESEMDPALRLPTAAGDKLRQLRREAEDLRLLHLGPYREMQDRRDLLAAVETRIEELIQRTKYPASHPLVEAEKAKAARLREEIAELSREADARRARSWPAAQLVKNVENYIEQTGRRTLTIAPETTAPKLAKGEAFADAIAKVRGKIGNLHAEMRAVKYAPLPSRESKQIVRGFVEALAEAGRPDVLPTVEAGRFPIFAPDMTPPATTPTPPVNVLGLLAFVMKDQFVAALEREIDANSDDSSALTNTERNERLAQLASELLHLEREEETLVCLGAASHQRISRRPDADPRAALGLSDSAPEPRDDF